MASTIAKLNRLLSIRTRIIGDIEHHIEEAQSFTQQSSGTAVSYRVTALEKSYKEFAEVSNSLESIPNYHELENLTEITTKNRNIQDKYLTIKLHVSELLDEDARALNSSFFQTTNTINTTEGGNADNFNPQRPGGIQLPKIQITPFEGQYDKWPEFKDIFTSLMNKYRGDEVERLTHLKNYLKGEAYQIVQHLAIKNGNYEIAWDLLTAQYENKNAIIEAHLRHFTEIVNITPTAPSSIRQAITTTRSCLAAIKNLEIVTDTWDPIIVFLLKDKLGPELRSKWEEERKGSHDPPTLKQFLEFLEVRHKIASSVPPRKFFPKTPMIDQKNKPRPAFHVLSSSTEQLEPEVPDLSSTLQPSEILHEGDDIDATFMFNRPEKCGVCDETHRIFTCPLLTQDSTEALRIVREKKLCLNCLYNHETGKCMSRGRCKQCQKAHHSLLHDAFANMNIPIQRGEQMFHTRVARGTVLATALIPIQTDRGPITLRALVDQGSTANLISTRGAQLLRCSMRRIIPTPMFGVGDVPTGEAKHMASMVMGSLYDENFKLSIRAYIANHITAIRPLIHENLAQWPHLQGLQLADPINADSHHIDMLIGNRTFAEIIDYGLIKGEPHQPIAQKTKLGWIISGGHGPSESVQLNTLITIDEEEEGDEEVRIHTLITENLSDQLKAFWEIEEVAKSNDWSIEEQECVDFFMKNVTRTEDGKFCMRIPFKIDSNSNNFLGDSLEGAKRRFYHLERRFVRNPDLKMDYTKCIKEYIELGHAVKVPFSRYRHVIPHHAVFKETSTTTKLRVVYDASAKTTNGYSLNERMYIGPKILEELWAVLLRWRIGEYAITSDIEKMYRQFWVHPDDAQFQQILWRDNPDDEFELYELRTVTFGTSSAPYMAIQGLLLIANAIEKEKPELAETIRKAFYVDDCLKSVDSIEEAVQTKKELTEVFTEYGLNLCKWNSNAHELLSEDTVDVKTHPMGCCTALGMQWNTADDELSFKVTLKKDVPKPTKRTTLSEIASLFDPMGLLAPTITRAKIFMQRLWLGTFGWDDELPLDLQQEWRTIKSMLLICANIKIPRWIGFKKRHNHLSIHGFCDASTKAYAAAIYVRTELENGTVEVHLLTAKTKVAPLKQVSIPRLELCAAELLSELMHKTKEAWNLPPCSIYAWTDSSVTLAWISTQPYKLKTFVGARVTRIQDRIEAEHWRYIKSAQNPADCATRCDYAGEIVSLTRWWNGPQFLLEGPENWPTTPPNMLPKKIPELRAKIMFSTEKEPEQENELLIRYSTLRRLLITTAYCLRWLKKNARFRTQRVLTPIEIENAKQGWIRHVQGIVYSRELEKLQAQKPIHTQSSLLSLTPVLDSQGLIRVKGRLNNSLLPENTKHPVILPAAHQLSTLIIRQAHYKAMHGGVQLTLRLIRDEYWIVKGKNLVKRLLGKCMTCFRDKCRPAQQQMADLLPPQVQSNRPFSHTGVDFAGYFEVKVSTKRNAPFTKCYISVFICLTTKAIHLELAHDLSTQAFIAVLHRFIARRGIPNRIYSDRGTNFVGTSKELPKLWYQEQTPESELIQRECTNQGISWHFNPARASHFGGLWEAGVKSVKTHLHRILRDTKLTFEEFNTLITQIEGCLNSRPLCPLSDDPRDYDSLTPGHFLIGQAITTPPHPDVRQIPMNRLSRFQYIQKLVQNFWDCWSHEYLARLQQRPKWKQQHENLQKGQLVIIREDNVPPSKWVLGRILETQPGKDGLVRSAMVRCKESTVSRPIHKLCLLPIEDNMNKDERLLYDQSLIPREDVDA